MTCSHACHILCSRNFYLLRRIFLKEDMYRSYAGHSKWANIKHTKAAKDSERAALFTRLSRQMRVAIEEGGSASPSVNVNLAKAIDQAKKFSMPIASIQQILKSAEKKDNIPRKQFLLEIKGPGGIVVIVDILTNNFPKAKIELSTILRKNKSLVSEGAKYLFEQKGMIHATSLKSYTLDMVIENAIEGGADDVSQIEDENGKSIFQFYCAPDVLKKLKTYLECNDYSVHFAVVEYLPLKTVELNEDNSKIAEKLLHSLSSHPDVVAMYDNFSGRF